MLELRLLVILALKMFDAKDFRRTAAAIAATVATFVSGASAWTHLETGFVVGGLWL